jgi:hypothetical protein
MAVRMLLVLAVVAIFYGCGQSGSSPEQSQEKRAGELESAVPVGPERLKGTKPVSVGQQLLSGVRDVGLYAMDPTGSNSTRLTDGVDPDWSPDGEQIAYTRYLKEPNPYASSAPSSVDADPYTETPAIFAMNADGSGGSSF